MNPYAIICVVHSCVVKVLTENIPIVLVCKAQYIAVPALEQSFNLSDQTITGARAYNESHMSHKPFDEAES